MRKFQKGDIVRELKGLVIGEVIKVDYDAGFDEVYVTYDGMLTDHCFGSNELNLIVAVHNRRDDKNSLFV